MDKWDLPQQEDKMGPNHGPTGSSAEVGRQDGNVRGR